MDLIRKLMLALAIGVFAISVTACESSTEEEAEEAAEATEDAAENAADDMEDAAEDAADDIEDAAE